MLMLFEVSWWRRHVASHVNLAQSDVVCTSLLSAVRRLCVVSWLVMVVQLRCLVQLTQAATDACEQSSSEDSDQKYGFRAWTSRRKSMNPCARRPDFRGIT